MDTRCHKYQIHLDTAEYWELVSVITQKIMELQGSPGEEKQASELSDVQLLLLRRLRTIEKALDDARK